MAKCLPPRVESFSEDFFSVLNWFPFSDNIIGMTFDTKLEMRKFVLKLRIEEHEFLDKLVENLTLHPKGMVRYTGFKDYYMADIMGHRLFHKEVLTVHGPGLTILDGEFKYHGGNPRKSHFGYRGLCCESLVLGPPLYFERELNNKKDYGSKKELVLNCSICKKDMAGIWIPANYGRMNDIDD